MPTRQATEAPTMKPAEAPKPTKSSFEFPDMTESAAVAHRANAMVLVLSSAGMFYFFL
jgi:hypothetical protein